MSVTQTYEVFSDDIVTGSSESTMGLQSPVDTYTISSNGYTWNAIGTGAITDVSITTQQDNSGQLHLRGENADIVVNGTSVLDLLKRMEQRLNLLSVNPELEQEWDELRELGDRYRELEQQIQTKMEIWSKLKSSDRANR